jgi:hypothetical protein
MESSQMSLPDSWISATYSFKNKFKAEYTVTRERVLLLPCLKSCFRHSNRWTQCNHHEPSCGVHSSWEGRATPPFSPLPLSPTWYAYCTFNHDGKFSPPTERCGGGGLGGVCYSAGQTPWLVGRPAYSDRISDLWSKVQIIVIFRKIFRKDFNQNPDQSPDICSKSSNDRKFSRKKKDLNLDIEFLRHLRNECRNSVW